MSYQPVTEQQINQIRSKTLNTSSRGKHSFKFEPFKEIGKCFFDFAIVDHHRVFVGGMVDEWFESAVPY